MATRAPHPSRSKPRGSPAPTPQRRASDVAASSPSTAKVLDATPDAETGTHGFDWHWLARSSRWSKAAGALLAVAAALALYGGVALWRLNAWLDADATVLAHYETVFYHDGQLRLSADRDLGALEEALLKDQLATGRDVVSLSRSETRREPWGRYSFVKVFMRTALPQSGGHTVSVKFAVRYRTARDGSPVILGTDTLGL